ncbi:MAG TPA: hypothetical protein VEH06_06800 [Candidatus Bathyarchaeia archaeon]|nr:hypothetical protein [Candidatus Bathyarchaeia archaeon]
MLWGINSEIIVGMALILIGILFIYASTTGGQTGLYWKAVVSYGVDYALFALGAAFIAHGMWTRANEKKVARHSTPHH